MFVAPLSSGHRGFRRYRSLLSLLLLFNHERKRNKYRSAAWICKQRGNCIQQTQNVCITFVQCWTSVEYNNIHTCLYYNYHVYIYADPMT